MLRLAPVASRTCRRVRVCVCGVGVWHCRTGVR
nr:MAG TPA: Nre [Caudoviricetes sp.]